MYQQKISKVVLIVSKIHPNFLHTKKIDLELLQSLVFDDFGSICEKLNEEKV